MSFTHAHINPWIAVGSLDINCLLWLHSSEEGKWEERFVNNSAIQAWPQGWPYIVASTQGAERWHVSTKQHCCVGTVSLPSQHHNRALAPWLSCTVGAKNSLHSGSTGIGGRREAEAGPGRGCGQLERWLHRNILSLLERPYSPDLGCVISLYLHLLFIGRRYK